MRAVRPEGGPASRGGIGQEGSIPAPAARPTERQATARPAPDARQTERQMSAPPAPDPRQTERKAGGEASEGNRRQRTGRLSEQRAADHLLRAGCSLLARNFRRPFGEIDLICIEGRTLVAVEVKTIARGWEPEEIASMVCPYKMVKIKRTLADFLANRPCLDYDDVRFDVMAVSEDGSVMRYKGVGQ